jgi:hypothetical protein
MADLSGAEKRKLEKLFGMSSGYVLDFSNRTFEEFVDEHTGRKIYEPVYMIGSGSKANCLRGFWAHESNYLVEVDPTVVSLAPKSIGGKHPIEGFGMIGHGDMVFRILFGRFRTAFWRSSAPCRKTSVSRQAYRSR